MERIKKVDNLPSVLPLAMIDTSPVYPGLMTSLHVAPGKSALAVRNALKRERMMGLLLPQKEIKLLPPRKEDKESYQISQYGFNDLHQKGVSVHIIKKILMPDDSINLLVQGVERFSIVERVQRDPYLCATVEYFFPREEKSKKVEALSREVIRQVKALSATNPYFTEEMKITMINAPSLGHLADMVAFAISLKGKEAQSYIETSNVRDRFLKLLVYLRREQDMANLQEKLKKEVDAKVEKFQREFFLKEQLKSIKSELGIDDKSRGTPALEKKLKELTLPKQARKAAEEEIERLKTIPEASPEFHLTRTYLDWIVDLPWDKATEDNLNLNHARKILDQGHFGLKDVKERILEYLAVRKLKPETKGTILCFVGPPGVGKTSMGQAIAKALNRKFFRFSLGGMRDEAEIKGHRRTYVGAMPGKILQGLKRTGSNNSVIMLDEVDKLGASFQGDPASALLEVLDPEQNAAFLDHYLDIPFDLSQVMFVANANSLESIPNSLIDRMEVIKISGYTLEEKEKIARKYVLPSSLSNHGLKNKDMKIKNSSIRKILNDYAREPGIRTLKQQIDKICRRVARMKVEKKNFKPIEFKEKNMRAWLGPERFHNEAAIRTKEPGVMTGLAWTAMGGEVLFIEAIALPGTGKLQLTGQMGKVMTESAKISLSHVHKYLSSFPKACFSASSGKKLPAHEWFQSHDIHLHMPAGAIPKDGPSAGITMACAILSLVMRQSARPRLAMTGELSLVGKVLPVGGVKDKVLAAKRSKLTTIILPEMNRHDLEEIPPALRKGIKFQFASEVSDVFKLAFSAKLKLS